MFEPYIALANEKVQSCDASRCLKFSEIRIRRTGLLVGDETPQDCRKKRLDVKSGESVSLDEAQVPTHLAMHRVIL